MAESVFGYLRICLVWYTRSIGWGSVRFVAESVFVYFSCGTYVRLGWASVK